MGVRHPAWHQGPYALSEFRYTKVRLDTLKSTARAPKKYLGFGGINDQQVLAPLGLGLLVSVNYEAFEGVPSMDYPGTS